MGGTAWIYLIDGQLRGVVQRKDGRKEERRGRTD
jgi:hypothetical protein